MWIMISKPGLRLGLCALMLLLVSDWLLSQVGGSSGVSICLTSDQCPTGYFCHIDYKCYPCYNCAELHRAAGQECAQDARACGKCLDGYEAKTEHASNETNTGCSKGEHSEFTTNRNATETTEIPNLLTRIVAMFGDKKLIFDRLWASAGTCSAAIIIYIFRKLILEKVWKALTSTCLKRTATYKKFARGSNGASNNEDCELGLLRNTSANNMDGTADNTNGTTENENGTTVSANGTADNTNGTAKKEHGTADNANGTVDNTDGTTVSANGTADNTNGTARNEHGTADNANGTVDNTNGTGNNANGTVDNTGSKNQIV